MLILINLISCQDKDITNKTKGIDSRSPNFILNNKKEKKKVRINLNNNDVLEYFTSKEEYYYPLIDQFYKKYHIDQKQAILDLFEELIINKKFNEFFFESTSKETNKAKKTLDDYLSDREKVKELIELYKKNINTNLELKNNKVLNQLDIIYKMER